MIPASIFKSIDSWFTSFACKVVEWHEFSVILLCEYTLQLRWELIKVNCKVRRPVPNHKSEHDFRICWISFTMKTLMSLESGYASAIWPYLSKFLPFSRFSSTKMTILGKIDNGEHLNIDRGPYFDHDERDQLLRHSTI